MYYVKSRFPRDFTGDLRVTCEKRDRASRWQDRRIAEYSFVRAHVLARYGVHHGLFSYVCMYMHTREPTSKQCLEHWSKTWQTILACHERFVSLTFGLVAEMSMGRVGSAIGLARVRVGHENNPYIPICVCIHMYMYMHVVHIHLAAACVQNA
jgi:hypothetical protein